MSWEAAEKRRFVRANFPCRMVIYTPHQHSIISHTENIGVGGIRVILDEKVEINSVVDLKIYIGDKSVACKGRIVWVVDKTNPISHKADMFDIGIEFLQIDAEDYKIISDLVNAIVSRKK